MAKEDTNKDEKNVPEMSREEQIGFHKGAIQTLVNERNEMIKIVQVTEAIIKSHLEALEKLGVKIERK